MKGKMVWSHAKSNANQRLTKPQKKDGFLTTAAFLSDPWTPQSLGRDHRHLVWKSSVDSARATIGY
jgi:hypothetical protein